MDADSMIEARAIVVVITIELYRLSVHYRRYHRVDLNILVEVGGFSDNSESDSGRRGRGEEAS